MNGKHQMLVYVDDVYMLGENLQTFREKNTEIFIKEAGHLFRSTVNSEKTKYTLPKKCNTLKDCVHWHLGHGHQRSDGAMEACLCVLCFDPAGSNYGRLRGEQCLQHSL